MRYRSVTIFTGKKLRVPQYIARLDSGSTHGWQLRYGQESTEYFADHSNDGSGARAALELAVAALNSRIRRHPAPTRLRSKVASGKTTKLPIGVSGPYEHVREGKVSYYSYQVSIPVPGAGSTTKKVYIGTRNTIDAKRKSQALAKAIAMRREAVERFAEAATKALRAAAREAVKRRAA